MLVLTGNYHGQRSCEIGMTGQLKDRPHEQILAGFVNAKVMRCACVLYLPKVHPDG